MAKVALLFGVSEYEPELKSLPAASGDIEAMKRVLEHPEMGCFDEITCRNNPDSQSMQYEIETLFSGRSKDDLLLLYFSGHGIKDDTNRLYFASRNTRKSQKGELIRSTAVPASFIHEVMLNSRARRQVIILDCCFSGAFDPQLQLKDDGSVDLQRQLGAEGRVVLTSSSSTQYSFEHNDYNLSIYTRYLVEGIETGAGDQDEDGKISVLELHEYAASKVKQTAPGMTPKLIILKGMGFDILLAKAKALDPELRFRRCVHKYATGGSISSVGQAILDTLQEQLGLSDDSVRKIIDEVLRPYQNRLKNLERYKIALISIIESEFTISSTTASELEDLQEILGLKKEDVVPIEREILAKKEIKVPNYQVQHFPKWINSRYTIEENLLKNPRLQYAGIRLRARAFVIDLIGSIGLVLSFTLLVGPISPLVLILYYVVPESISGSTFGKEITNISVTDQNGNRIRFGNSFCRFIIKYFLFCSVFGIVWGIWNTIFKATKKVVIYDVWTDSFVIVKSRTKSSKLPQREVDLGYASPTQRLTAFTIDLLFLLFSALLIIQYIVDNFYFDYRNILGISHFCFCLFILYFSIFEKFTGATLGKLITGICVADMSGKRVTFKIALLRGVIKAISILSFGVGAVATGIAIFKSPQRQGLHDLGTKTIVLTKRRFHR
ncbi:MAG: hypothetical protein F6K41_19555 [Symploca sp. SIO3E6]|nr:hypothetical protein [Caldora sp. SIO3E6]